MGIARALTGSESYRTPAPLCWLTERLRRADRQTCARRTPWHCRAPRNTELPPRVRHTMTDMPVPDDREPTPAPRDEPETPVAADPAPTPATETPATETPAEAPVTETPATETPDAET